MTPEHELESEDDEAPEEVTFQRAESQAKESARARREAANREKALLKEKRKRKEELFKEQKKKKLLPDDILQSISSAPDKREEQSEELEDPNQTGKEESVKKKYVKKLRPRKRLQDNYKVVRVQEFSANSVLQQKAKAFMHRKLYGKTKNRTSATEFFSISAKRSAVKKPAVQFTDNSWGKEMKEKAEKFNLKWADTRKL